MISKGNMLLIHPRRSASSLACNASSSDIGPPVAGTLLAAELTPNEGTCESPKATGCLFKTEAGIESPVGASVS